MRVLYLIENLKLITEGTETMQWIKDRIKERTSWDGGALIAVGLVILLLGPLAKWAAYAAVVWGVITLIKSE